jgi:hypothetical protein
MDKKLETPQETFRLRPFQPGDEGKLLDLWRQAFQQELDPAVLAWKFWNNPFGTQVMLCLAEDGLPVVMFSGIPYAGRYEGRRVQLTHAMDTMSHPRYRGTISGRRGLFVQTAEHFLQTQTGSKASAFVYGLPGERHFRLGSMLLGYARLPGQLKHMTWTVESQPAAIKPFRGRLIRLDSLPDAGLDCVASELGRSYPFHVCRDSAFYSWRFAQHPVHEYDLWLYGSGIAKRIKGALAIRRHGQQATIVDLFMAPEPDAVQDLIARLTAVYRRFGMTSLQTWLPCGHPVTETFAGCCLERQEPFGIVPSYVARTFDRRLPHAAGAEKLFYTMADGDLL